MWKIMEHEVEEADDTVTTVTDKVDDTAKPPPEEPLHLDAANEPVRTNALLHKDVIGVTEFFEKTGFDGKGVTVAVMDTGIDPGADVLSRTKDGRIKVVDMLDLTGDGDVEMGSEVECWTDEDSDEDSDEGEDGSDGKDEKDGEEGGKEDEEDEESSEEEKEEEESSGSENQKTKKKAGKKLKNIEKKGSKDKKKDKKSKKKKNKRKDKKDEGQQKDKEDDTKEGESTKDKDVEKEVVADAEKEVEEECGKKEKGDGFLTGMSGRKLRISKKIRDLCPTGKYRLGIKTAWSMWPHSLARRVRNERKKQWEKDWREAYEQARRQLYAMEMREDEESIAEKLKEREEQKRKKLEKKKKVKGKTSSESKEESAEKVSEKTSKSGEPAEKGDCSDKANEAKDKEEKDGKESENAENNATDKKEKSEGAENSTAPEEKDSNPEDKPKEGDTSAGSDNKTRKEGEREESASSINGKEDKDSEKKKGEAEEKMKEAEKKKKQQMELEEKRKKEAKRLKKLRAKKNRAERKEELTARLDYLTKQKQNYNDPGPVYDCVTFHDGKQYRAIVDTAETGNLEKAPLLENYRVNCRYATFTNSDQLNFAVNLYEDGKLMSIVVDEGDHGTHVAGIVSEIAPNCQLVSLKISDNRIGTTQQSKVRALTCMMKHDKGDEANKSKYHKVDVDLVNLSFGVPTSDELERGNQMDLVRSLVREHNVMFFSSAGNEGPAFSTVNAPGSINSDIISVGAYITKEMLLQAFPSVMLGEHFHTTTPSGSEISDDVSDTKDSSKDLSEVPASSTSDEVRKKESEENEEKDKKESGDSKELGKFSTSSSIEALPFTFSSRGPGVSGALTVSVAAPGAAYSPVPQWTLNSKSLYQGTSMASPSACGAAAVLLSYLKAEKISYNTTSVRRALEITAKPLSLSHFGADDPLQNIEGTAIPDGPNSIFAVGYGSVYIPKAAEYLRDSHKYQLPLNQRRKRADRESASKDEKLLVIADENSPRESDLHLEQLRISCNVYLYYPNGYTSPRRKGVYIRRTCAYRNNGSSTVMAKIALKSCFDLYKDTPAAKQARTSLDVTILLKTAEKWVKTPATVIFTGHTQVFRVAIDLGGVQPGTVNYSEIQGFVRDREHKLRGPLFRVPITVILGEDQMLPVRNIPLRPGSVMRKFISPPFGATYFLLEISAASNYGYERRVNDAREISVQIAQLSDKESPHRSISYVPFLLKPGDTNTRIVPITDGSLLELCIAQEWDCFGRTVIESINYSFGGLTVSSESIKGRPGHGFEPLTVVNKLEGIIGTRGERSILPELSLYGYFDTVSREKAPLAISLRPLGYRDRLPKSRQLYAMKIEYEFQLKDKMTVSLRHPSLYNLHYDAIIGGGPLIYLFDENKQFLGSAENTRLRRRLKKGTYTVFTEVRDQNCQFLESLKKLPLTIDIHLKSRIKVSAYTSRQGASLQKHEDHCYWAHLELGDRRKIWFGSDAHATVPKSNKWVEVGDTLLGSFRVDPYPDSMKGVVHGSVPWYKLSCDVLPIKDLGKDLSSDDSSTDGSSDSDFSDSDSSDDDSEEEDSSEESSDASSKSGGKDESSESGEMKATTKPSSGEEKVKELQENAKKRMLTYYIEKKEWAEFDKFYKSLEICESKLDDEFTLDVLRLKLQRHVAKKKPLNDVLTAAGTILKLEDNRYDIVGKLGSRPDPEENEEARKKRKLLQKQRDVILYAHFTRLDAVLSKICEKLEKERKKSDKKSTGDLKETKAKASEDESEQSSTSATAEESNASKLGENETAAQEASDSSSSGDVISAKENNDAGTDKGKAAGAKEKVDDKSVNENEGEGNKDQKEEKKDARDAKNRAVKLGRKESYFEMYERFWKALESWLTIKNEAARASKDKYGPGGVWSKEWKKLLIKRETVHKRYAMILKLLKDENDEEETNNRIDLLDRLGWKFEKERELRRKLMRFPKSFLPFSI